MFGLPTDDPRSVTLSNGARSSELSVAKWKEPWGNPVSSEEPMSKRILGISQECQRPISAILPEVRE